LLLRDVRTANEVEVATLSVLEGFESSTMEEPTNDRD
jgi:hypothetical protein